MNNGQVLAAKNIEDVIYLTRHLRNGGNIKNNPPGPEYGKPVIQYPDKGLVYPGATIASLITIPDTIKSQPGLYKKYTLCLRSKTPDEGSFFKGFKKIELFSFRLYAFPKSTNHAA